MNNFLLLFYCKAKKISIDHDINLSFVSVIEEFKVWSEEAELK